MNAIRQNYLQRAKEIPNRWPTDVKVDIISNVN